MKTLAKWMNWSWVLIIVVSLAMLSLPTILTAGESERAAGPEDRRLRQQELLNRVSHKAMAKAQVQQARMRQWRSDQTRLERSAAKAAKLKLQNDRKAGGSAQ